MFLCLLLRLLCRQLAEAAPVRSVAVIVIVALYYPVVTAYGNGLFGICPAVSLPFAVPALLLVLLVLLPLCEIYSCLNLRLLIVPVFLANLVNCDCKNGARVRVRISVIILFGKVIRSQLDCP